MLFHYTFKQNALIVNIHMDNMVCVRVYIHIQMQLKMVFPGTEGYK